MNNKKFIVLLYFFITIIFFSCNKGKLKTYEVKSEKKNDIVVSSDADSQENKKDKNRLVPIDSNITFDDPLLSKKNIINLICFDKKYTTLSKESIIKKHIEIAPYLKDSISYYYDQCEENKINLSSNRIIKLMCFDKNYTSLSKDSIITKYIDIAPYLKDSISYFYDLCE